MNPVDRPFRRLLSTVPEVTIFFWIVKILSAAVGETLADLVGPELTLTAAVSGVLLGGALVVQFHIRRYVPGVYWAVVVLAAVVGTLIPDDLMIDWSVSPTAAAIAFAVALAATYAAWYAIEKTLSIHTVDTPRREAFYWLAVLLTFALGTAAGDLTTLGYGASTALFAVLVAVVAGGRRLGLNSVVAFWAAFVLTGPLGASVGDLLTQPSEGGGLGFGVALTGLAFVAAIVAVVAYLTRSSADRPSLGVARRLRSRAW
jgi:uncharacterized membrane-anchored protein